MKRLLRRRLLHGSWVQAALARLLGLYLRFALATTRWTLVGGEHVAPLVADGSAVVAFWHEHLALMPQLWREARAMPGGRARRIHVMASRHRDGRLIGAILAQFGMNVVPASSSRGGAAGLKAAVALLARGDLVGIVPDGPRGPRRVPAPGMALLAALSGHPIVPCGAQVSRRRILRTWDRMVIPLPFGRGVLVCGAPIAVPRDGWQEALPGIAAALSAASDRADALAQGGLTRGGLTRGR